MSTFTFPRRFSLLLLLGGLLLVLTLALPRLTTGAGGTDVELGFDSYATGLSSPVAIASAGDSRLFVVEQGGVIRVVEDGGTVLGTPFISLTDRVETGGEQGLLGMVFDPDYETNGYFYVQYTYCTSASCPNSGSTPNLYTRVSRFSVTGDPDVADPNSELIIIEVQQPYGNHNAGDIAFVPDGYLYVPLGDGGSGGDPENRAQNPAVLLGKMLRIDVHPTTQVDNLTPDCDPDGNYAVPADNPFIGAGGTCDEIWALGLRNPWRFSFDRNTDDMWIGDVGQSTREEVSFQAAASSGGENYGWDCWEGNFYYDGNPDCVENPPPDEFVFPVFDYNRANGSTVIGGYVYRGSQYPFLNGHYLLADFGSDNWWTLSPDGGSGWTVTTLGDLGISNPVGFGQDENGELYVASLTSGTIYHITESRPDLPFDIYDAPVILTE